MVYGSYEHVPISYGVVTFFYSWVTVENDDVSTELIRNFIIELGIWVIRACANFIRGLSRFFTAGLL